jgi:hypothetical protein
MKTNENKTEEVIVSEIDFYKKYFIFNEFQKKINKMRFVDVEEDFIEFIKDSVDDKVISAFSSYGNEIYNLDFSKCPDEIRGFFNFIGVDFEFFAKTMYKIYNCNFSKIESCDDE